MKDLAARVVRGEIISAEGDEKLQYANAYRLELD